MTRNASARLAGFMFLFYIATAIPETMLFSTAAAGNGVAAKLANIAQHAMSVRVSVLLSLLTFVNAVLLGVALYGITRDEDHEIAIFALACRVGEGVINALAAIVVLALLWVATGAGGVAAPDAATANALGALLLKVRAWKTLVGGLCFAVGSTAFACLFVRARTIPAWLAWLGVIGSALLVVGFPAHLIGIFNGPMANLMWVPVAVFEVVLGFRLLIKGIDTPAERPRI
jgi:hypothetical protein